MKISYQWLQTYIPISESPEDIANRLTQSGLEVTGIETFPPTQAAPLPTDAAEHRYTDEQPDTIFSIELTPNRIDACSHFGVARELGAILTRPVNPLPVVKPVQPAVRMPPVQVHIADTNACPRYTGVVMAGVTVQASPRWLQDRLRSLDVGPVNNVVDVTQFVMYELGHPLHAFDYDEIQGKKIDIGLAKAHSLLPTLDRITRKLTGAELVVSDQAGGIALAGVLGGYRGRVGTQTRNVFLESAYFSPSAVRKTAQLHGLQTAAAFRYERGADPNMPLYALQRAMDLLQETAAGQVGSPMIDIYPQKIPTRSIQVRYHHIARIVGEAIPKAAIHTILHNLDIRTCEDQVGSFIARVPPYRVDVTREIDVIEEILRIYGYDRISVPDTVQPAFAVAPQVPSTSAPRLASEVAMLLAAKGYYELCTSPLVASTDLTHSHVAGKIHIVNPLSERLDVMRTTLLDSGLSVMAHNMRRQQMDLKFFELGKIYRQEEEDSIEQNRLGIWITGNVTPPHWLDKPRLVTFQDLQGIVYTILSRVGITDCRQHTIEDHLYARGIQVVCQGVALATVGSVASELLARCGIKQHVFFADINWDAVLNRHEPGVQHRAISKFPAVKRDLSLVIDQHIAFADIAQLVKQQNEALIQEVSVFDVYQGDTLPTDKKAYALTFVLQDAHQTLDENRIQQVMTKLIQLFTEELRAIIRQ